jgi:hypothetical protein
MATNREHTNACSSSTLNEEILIGSWRGTNGCSAFSEQVFAELVEAGHPGNFFINFLSSLCQDIPEWIPGTEFKESYQRLRQGLTFCSSNGAAGYRPE